MGADVLVLLIAEPVKPVNTVSTVTVVVPVAFAEAGALLRLAPIPALQKITFTLAGHLLTLPALQQQRKDIL